MIIVGIFSKDCEVSSILVLSPKVISYSWTSPSIVPAEDDIINIINCGRVAHGEKFKYKYYKSYVEVEYDNKLVYVDNTNYNPKEMDIENFGMYEGYTHFANILIANFTNNNEVLNTIREMMNLQVLYLYYF